jgi:hypothetical protein
VLSLEEIVLRRYSAGNKTRNGCDSVKLEQIFLEESSINFRFNGMWVIRWPDTQVKE